MNESGLLDGFFKKDRIKKFDLKKKLELTEDSSRTTFWKYDDQHSIGKSIQIAILTSASRHDFYWFPNGMLIIVFPKCCPGAIFR